LSNARFFPFLAEVVSLSSSSSKDGSAISTDLVKGILQLWNAVVGAVATQLGPNL